MDIWQTQEKIRKMIFHVDTAAGCLSGGTSAGPVEGRIECTGHWLSGRQVESVLCVEPMPGAQLLISASLLSE